MKYKMIPVLLILTALLSACNNKENPKDHLGEIYTLALDSLMEKDKALNSEMEFIAIDMSNFDGVNEEQKKTIVNHFKDKYKVEVMNATMDDLEEKGYLNPDTMALDGVLLRIENVDFTFTNNVLFEGSKFKSGLGAIGVEGTVHYKNGEWRMKELEETWVS
ncbi:peptide ABC transporter substrate-binding protein [Rossellomorea sp. NPDC077527]|uniref:peptide ABC transporter substrate-binding protein n=1 Tax=Rossellomorea sp. NPDC077527 TaxID=3364510 RepID=UPI0037CCA162